MEEEQTYCYSFTDGTVAELTASKSWISLLLELDRQEANNNQTERRRHCPLDWYRDRIPSSCNPYQEVLGSILWEALCSRLDKQETLAAQLYFYHGMSQREIAARLGCSQTRVSQVLRKIRRLAKMIFYSD